MNLINYEVLIYHAMLSMVEYTSENKMSSEPKIIEGSFVRYLLNSDKHHSSGGWVSEDKPHWTH